MDSIIELPKSVPFGGWAIKIRTLLEGMVMYICPYFELMLGALLILLNLFLLNFYKNTICLNFLFFLNAESPYLYNLCCSFHSEYWESLIDFLVNLLFIHLKVAEICLYSNFNDIFQNEFSITKTILHRTWQIFVFIPLKPQPGWHHSLNIDQD